MMRRLKGLMGHRQMIEPTPFLRPPVNPRYKRPFDHMTVTAQEWCDGDN